VALASAMAATAARGRRAQTAKWQRAAWGGGGGARGLRCFALQDERLRGVLHSFSVCNCAFSVKWFTWFVIEFFL